MMIYSPQGKVKMFCVFVWCLVVVFRDELLAQCGGDLHTVLTKLFAQREVGVRCVRLTLLIISNALERPFVALSGWSYPARTCIF